MPSINPPSLQSLASGLPGDVGVKLGAALRAADKNNRDIASALNSALVVGDTVLVLTPYTSAAPLVVPADWNMPSLNAGWTGSGGHPVQYRKSSTGHVQLEGLAVSATNGTIFTLPSGYAPDVDRFIPVLMSTGGTTSMQYLRVNANGDVSSNNVSGSTSAPTTWVDIGSSWYASSPTPYVPSCFPFDVLWPNAGTPSMVLAQCMDANSASPSNLAIGVTDWTTVQKGNRTLIHVRNIPGLLPSTSYSVTLVAL